MSRHVTIPFHVSSQAARNKGNNRFEIPLDPPLDIGHTAHPTVYLNNLSFTNTFANVDKALYDNADLVVKLHRTLGSGSPLTISIPTGNYTLSQLEVAINTQLYSVESGSYAQYAAGITANFPPADSGLAAGRAFDVSQAVERVNLASQAVELEVQVRKDISVDLDDNSILSARLEPVSPLGLSEHGLSYADALTASEIQALVNDGVLPPLAKGVMPSGDLGAVDDDGDVKPITFGFKAVSLDPDFSTNRVAITLGPGVEIDQSDNALNTLMYKVLGRSIEATFSERTSNSAFTFDFLTGDKAARIDKTRAVAFHCPSLASGTFGTDGSHGDSQLAVVPITVDIGAVQSWETFEPIRIPSHVAGGPVSTLCFYISNEEGEEINTLGERFEAVMVVEYDVPLGTDPDKK